METLTERSNHLTLSFASPYFTGVVVEYGFSGSHGPDMTIESIISALLPWHINTTRLVFLGVDVETETGIEIDVKRGGKLVRFMSIRASSLVKVRLTQPRSRRTLGVLHPSLYPTLHGIDTVGLRCCDAVMTTYRVCLPAPYVSCAAASKVGVTADSRTRMASHCLQLILALSFPLRQSSCFLHVLYDPRLKWPQANHGSYFHSPPDLFAWSTSCRCHPTLLICSPDFCLNALAAVGRGLLRLYCSPLTMYHPPTPELKGFTVTQSVWRLSAPQIRNPYHLPQLLSFILPHNQWAPLCNRLCFITILRTSSGSKVWQRLRVPPQQLIRCLNPRLYSNIRCHLTIRQYCS